MAAGGEAVESSSTAERRRASSKAEVDEVIRDSPDEYDDLQTAAGNSCWGRCSGELTPMHLTVFALTFLSYTLFHASRKTFSNVKTSLKDVWISNDSVFSHNQSWSSPRHALFPDTKAGQDEATNFLGYLDAIFMFSYAVGLYFSGWVGDRVEPRYVLTFGMVGSGVSLILFGFLTELLQFYNIAFYVVTWILFGLTQACGWPMEVAIMSRWFGKGNRGLVLGLWASCQSVGNIVGALLVSKVLVWGYEYAFLLNACLMIGGGVVVFFGLVSDPHDVGIAVDEEPRKEEDAHRAKPEPVSLAKALMLPGVLPYCLSNACLKLTNYAFFFWLPFYLSTRFQWREAQADAISVWYDVGAVVGSIVGGLVSDWMGCRTPTVVVMLAGSIAALYGYSESKEDIVENEALMTVVGALVGGPYNLIAATVAADLGTQPALAGNAAALSTVTGLIDGSGSLGSGIGQIAIPFIETSGPDGWTYVFWLFIGMNSLALVLLLPRLWGNVKERWPGLCTRPEERRSLLRD